MKKDILQTEHSIEKEVQIVTKNKKYNIIEATVELHRENYIVKKQKYGLYKAGLLLEHPILLQGLGPLPCLMLSTGVLIDHTCLSQILAIGFLYIFYIKSIKKRTLTDTRTQKKPATTSVKSGDLAATQDLCSGLGFLAMFLSELLPPQRVHVTWTDQLASFSGGVAVFLHWFSTKWFFVCLCVCLAVLAQRFWDVQESEMMKWTFLITDDGRGIMSRQGEGLSQVEKPKDHPPAK